MCFTSQGIPISGTTFIFMHIFTYFCYVSLCPCHGQTAAIYLWRITTRSSFPTAAAGHPVIKFTRALESELSRRLPGNITVSGCKCNGCTGCMHPPLQGRTLVRAAGSVRHRPTGRAESVPSAGSWTCQGPTTPRHRQNKSNPASPPTAPPLTVAVSVANVAPIWKQHWRPRSKDRSLLRRPSKWASCRAPAPLGGSAAAQTLLISPAELLQPSWMAQQEDWGG